MEIEFIIDDFEGPLDLLLHLIKENKMDILDIEIEKITDQYIAYLNKMEEMNLEVTSNYLVLASELLYIKSRMLLPREKNENEDEEEDPRGELVNRLLEYQSYKDISGILKDKEHLRSEIYTKAPESLKEYIDTDTEIKMTSDVSLDDLVDAFKKFLERQKEDKPLNTKVTNKEIKVSDRKISIKSILKTKKHVRFFDLFENYNKEYIVATFLAILELAKEGEMRIVQQDSFSDIECEAV